MTSERIVSLETRDAQFPLESGAGTDAVHSGSEYAFATTLLATANGMFGTGIALTLGRGNQLVCEAAEMLGASLVGREIGDLMANFGGVSRQLAQDPQLRWLGPHKGVVHLALASLTNACFDLWAKARGLPLWRLLLDLTPRQVVDLLDLSYLEYVLAPEEALKILVEHSRGRFAPEAVLRKPIRDTTPQWDGSITKTRG
jgi:L-fuconate dehydratase